MKIHYLQHVPFETPASILTWAHEKGHTISSTHCYRNDPFPEQNAFDFLLVMGGPMNIYQEDLFSWLKDEKQFISESIKAGKIVLGICLGAQLISDALGGKVTRNQDKEIGWFPVYLTDAAKTNPLFKNFPESFSPLHWHGDTFELAPGAIRAASSEGCMNQAFFWGDKVVGLQFHLEMTSDSLETIIQHCADELVPGKYIQDAEKMMSYNHEEMTIPLMNLLLENITQNY